MRWHQTVGGNRLEHLYGNDVTTTKKRWSQVGRFSMGPQREHRQKKGVEYHEEVVRSRGSYAGESCRDSLPVRASFIFEPSQEVESPPVQKGTGRAEEKTDALGSTTNPIIATELEMQEVSIQAENTSADGRGRRANTAYNIDDL